ncbi:MAG: DUF4097 domain-containing protein [Oligoflexia bacterium]|nr:DUF4097 domain-containing protein [Oligoflexia bacterium]
MTRWRRIKGVCLLAAFAASSGHAATEYTAELERVIPLRANGTLQVINNRGDVVIEGWAQDKVRVRGRKRALADTEEEAQRLFSAIDFRSRTIEGGVELSAEYGRGLSIEERLKERSNPRTGMAMHVLAPSNLPLRVWAVAGKVFLKSWRGSVELRSASGEIRVEAVRGKNAVSILCPSCAMTVENIRGPLRCLGGSGKIHLKDIEGASIYVESAEGPVVANRISGEQLYVVKSGALQISDSDGHVEFHGQQGDVKIEDGMGFVSGRTTSGNIFVGMRRWVFHDKALIESTAGNISLVLPRDLSADLEVASAQGKVTVTIPLQSGQAPTGSTPRSSSRHVVGTAGDGGELLKVTSDTGDIVVTNRK